MTRIFKKLDTFKDAYDLQDLRFAVTLWTKWPGEEEFRPTDIQYISEVSTEDRKVKEYIYIYMILFRIVL